MENSIDYPYKKLHSEMRTLGTLNVLHASLELVFAKSCLDE